MIPALFLVSCEEETEWEYLTENNDRLVVDAVLTNELRFQEIRLSKSFNDLNGTPPPVTDAVVKVSVGPFVVNFIHSDDTPGLYRSEILMIILNNLVYDLTIEWEGEMYTASSELSDVAPMPQITFRPLGETGLLVFGDFAPFYSANQQAMYEMNVNWAFLTGDSTSLARTYFYTFSSIDINQTVLPTTEPIAFPPGSLVVARKFGLNDDYAEYLRALVIETNWNGSVLFANPASLPTNISNGALGFFSTCSVLTTVTLAF